jgi:hypothetical protein
MKIVPDPERARQEGGRKYYRRLPMAYCINEDERIGFLEAAEKEWEELHEREDDCTKQGVSYEPACVQ